MAVGNHKQLDRTRRRMKVFMLGQPLGALRGGSIVFLNQLLAKHRPEFLFAMLARVVVALAAHSIQTMAASGQVRMRSDRNRPGNPFPLGTAGAALGRSLGRKPSLCESAVERARRLGVRGGAWRSCIGAFG